MMGLRANRVEEGIPFPSFMCPTPSLEIVTLASEVSPCSGTSMNVPLSIVLMAVVGRRAVRSRQSHPSVMHISRSLLTGSLLLCASVSPAARAQGAPKAGEIRGRLVETGTSRPLTAGSITVRKSGADTSFAGGALPKADGTFRVDGLAAGRYTVRIRALGYVPVVKS